MRFRRFWPALVLGIGLAVLPPLVVGAPAQAELPPRFTVVPTPTPGPAALPAGATLMLHVIFPEGWDFDVNPWYAPWTAVQWQDAQGGWHTVAGWQGHLDEVSVEAGTVTGRKVWWVGLQNLGTGPFRWMIYTQYGGALLAESEPFTLPSLSGAWEIVEVPITLQDCTPASRTFSGTCCPPR